MFSDGYKITIPTLLVSELQNKKAEQGSVPLKRPAAAQKRPAAAKAFDKTELTDTLN